MTEEETVRFLTGSKALMRLASVRRDGYPDVHVVWCTFLNDKIYTTTHKKTRKVENLRFNNKVSFTIDLETPPFKGVRGRGVAKLIEDATLSRKILTMEIMKYIGNLEDPLAKELLSLAPEEYVIEIKPLYFATWDESK
jgi:general stress protein 26